MVARSKWMFREFLGVFFVSTLISCLVDTFIWVTLDNVGLRPTNGLIFLYSLVVGLSVTHAMITFYKFISSGRFEQACRKRASIRKCRRLGKVFSGLEREMKPLAGGVFSEIASSLFEISNSLDKYFKRVGEVNWRYGAEIEGKQLKELKREIKAFEKLCSLAVKEIQNDVEWLCAEEKVYRALGEDIFNNLDELGGCVVDEVNLIREAMEVALTRFYEVIKVGDKA